MPRIQGITKSALWQAWKNVRKQLSRASLRDVTDFVEYDIDPSWWIDRLLKDLRDGRYEPTSPHRFRMAKKMGFSRQMALLSIPDTVLYRATVDLLFEKAKTKQQEHVYFAQNTLSKRIRGIAVEVNSGECDYTFTSGSAFAEWLKFDQYRKQLLLDRIYPFIVTTDVTNYFDTVLYDRVVASTHGIRNDSNLVGLLLFILERLSVRDAFNESPRIGLPVDEFDCSRTLAHLVLFPHDERMVKVVGKSGYVRWMDDQTFGAHSYSEGLNILKACGESLARLHLTPNAAKSRIMSLSQASRHFHFDANADLDKLEEAPRATPADLRQFRHALKQTWEKHREREGEGEWGKILKRFYRLAGLARAQFLRPRATKDALNEPVLAGRVAEYMRVVSTPKEYIDFVLSLWMNEEQVYADVNHVLAEGLLKLEPDMPDARRIRAIASDLLYGNYSFPGWKRCAALAPLLLLRFGDRRSLSLLKRLINNIESTPHPAIAKAVVAVYVSYGEAEYREAVEAASRLRKNYLAHFLRMIDECLRYQSIPDRFKIRRKPVFDVVAGVDRLDMRKFLTIRLLSLNQIAAAQSWIEKAKEFLIKSKISDFDKNLVIRLLPSSQKSSVPLARKIEKSNSRNANVERNKRSSKKRQVLNEKKLPYGELGERG